MKHITTSILALLIFACTLQAQQREVVNAQWQNTLLAAIDSFPVRGGYYTGGKPNDIFPVTTWRALNNAFVMTSADNFPYFNCKAATPSFCSSATYSALIKALTMWDTEHKISKQAWVNMKPYVGIADELNPEGLGMDDGVGFWGRANANGPSIAVLVNELKAGFSYTAYRGAKSPQNKETEHEAYLTDDQWNHHPIWNRMVPGDFVKIFWNRNDSRNSDSGAIIGYDGVKGHDQEAGHSVIFMGFDSDDNVRYWSSNGPGKDPKNMGYYVATCPKTAIQRIVVTRIMKPQNFDRVKTMPPTDVNQYLYDLNGKRHSDTVELLKQAGIKKPGF